MPLTLSGHLMLDSQLVCDHGDEFAIGGLGLADVDRVAEQVADGIDVAARPGDLDRVADGAFYAGWRGFEFFGDCRIERLRDGAQNFNVVVHHSNRFAQVLISFNMRRNTDFMYNRRNIGVQIFAFGHRHDIGFDRGCHADIPRRYTLSAYKLTNPARKNFHIKRFKDVI